MELSELKAQYEALKSENILTVSRLEDSRNEALELARKAIKFAEDAFVALDALAERAEISDDSFAFYGDEGIK